jgi:putative ABC transport system permease protein
MRSIQPPRFANKLLKWFCDPDLLEDVEGDLNELFDATASENIRKAKWLYTLEVMKLFRPGIIKKVSWFNPVNNTQMLLNHITTAIRQAGKYKGYTAINIAGLVVGLASCMLILLWVADETNKDQFHEKSDRIYQVWRNLPDAGGVQTTGGIPFPLEHVLRTQYPEIESVTSLLWETEALFRVNEISSYEKGRYATPGFFDVFSYPLIVGDPKKQLTDVSSMLISDRMALKLFGNDWRVKAVGQSIRVDERRDFEVSGVFETPGDNSSLTFDWLAAGQGYIDRNEWIDSWYNGGFSMYFTLKPGVGLAAVSAKLEKEIIRNTNNQSNEPLFMQLYAEHYLHGTFENGVVAGGRIQYVRILSAIAGFLLLLAAINFMNLATARSSLRAREIGVRKVMGAQRTTLRQQFFIESILNAIVSTLVAAIIVYLLLPYFNTLTGKNIHIVLSEPLTWLVLAGVILMTGMLSGVYPAFMLSSLSVARSLKGKTKRGMGTNSRHALVTLQFSISIFLISGTIIISKQLNYILNKDAGLKRNDVVGIDLMGGLWDKREAYVNLLRTIPDVADVTLSASNPTDFDNSTGGAQWPGKDPNSLIEIAVLTVGEDFVKTMGMEIAKGEDFSNVFLRDSARFLINEVMAGIMGGGDQVGKQLSVWRTTGTIAGVVKNFHVASMYNKIGPVIIRYRPSETSTAYIRINGDTPDALAAIERVTKELNPAFPFRYSFLDDDFASQYRGERSVSSLVNIFAGVSIFIACLGLLGLSSFSADQRAKEIGVRKVHGASTRSLIMLLSKQYAILMIIAFVIAAPLSYFYMQKWLADFAYRTDLNITLFIVAGATTFAIGALTVSYKSYSAATANPVKTLKEE